MTALMVWLHTHPRVGRFFQATGQRVVRSFAASLLSSKVIGGAVLATVTWSDALSVAGGAALVTLLLCVAGQATTGDGPSFGGAETTMKES